MKKMLAVLKEKPQPGVTIKHIPIPKAQKGEVLIKVLGASICGTDIGIYDWIPWAASNVKPPVVIGHEVVGKIIEINGDAPHLKKGDIVSSETHIFDGTCYQCAIGNTHICENVKLFGISRNGGFAEYSTIPIITTWKNDSSISLQAMSVQEPLGNAVNVITRAHVPGKKVLIVGLGPTGLCAGMVAKAYGADEVVGLNRGAYRRNLAKKVRFDRVLKKLDPKEYGSFDVVAEMSGSLEGFQVSLDAVRIAGTLIAFGIPKREIGLDVGKYLINKELVIKAVYGRRIWKTWHQVSRLLISKKVDLEKIITHTFALKDFEKAMKVMKSGECGKILLTV